MAKKEKQKTINNPKGPKSWQPEKVTIIFNEINEEEMKQRLAELAEIFYHHFCQLRKSQTIVSGDPELKRTGT